MTELEQDALYEYLEHSGLLGRAERLGGFDRLQVELKKELSDDPVYREICDELIRQSGFLSGRWQNPRRQG